MFIIWWHDISFTPSISFTMHIVCHVLNSFSFRFQYQKNVYLEIELGVRANQRGR